MKKVYKLIIYAIAVPHKESWVQEARKKTWSVFLDDLSGSNCTTSRVERLRRVSSAAAKHSRRAEGTPLSKTFCFTINAEFKAAFKYFWTLL